MSLRAPIAAPLDAPAAWTLLRELVERNALGEPIVRRTGLRIESNGVLRRVAPELGSLWVDPAADPCFGSYRPLATAAAWLFDLYLPLCLGSNAETLVLAHLGQSLDGQIATASGASRYVTGPENLEHIHRLRALSDAVVVGAETVERDDPQLTTRLVEGKSPARVVIDPNLRVDVTRQVFTCGQPQTFVVCRRSAATRRRPARGVELVEIPEADGPLEPRRIVAALTKLGLRRLFVEGGGVTVSRFLQARALDRLHITVSPLIIGAGRPGLALPPIDALECAIRPRARRFDLGDDVLFDCQLDATPESGRQ